MSTIPAELELNGNRCQFFGIRAHLVCVHMHSVHRGEPMMILWAVPAYFQVHPGLDFFFKKDSIIFHFSGFGWNRRYAGLNRHKKIRKLV